MTNGSNDELKPNTTLQNGRYEIVKVIGIGTFSISYLAHEFNSDNKAVKRNVFLKEFYIRDFNYRNGNNLHIPKNINYTFENYQRLFRNSFEYVSEMNHPGIIKALNIFAENNTCYSVYEYIDGINLNDYIRENHPIDNNEALSIISQIGDAIKHIHSKGIVHLDIKPLNIIRSKDGRLHLGGFDIAGRFDEAGNIDNDDYMPMGTSGYAPLEQLSYHSNGSFPATIDVYALAATFYKILTNQTPRAAHYIIDEGLPFDILKKDCRPEAFINGITKGMSINRRNRFQTVEEFITAISGYKSELKGEAKEHEIVDALPIGTILIGKAYRYTIEKVLDQGAFGITYKASVKMEGELGMLDTGVTVAIKEFFMEKINSRENTIVTGSKKNRTFTYYKAKFIKEAISLSKLNHPNIVKVVEQFEANNTAYYVMEFIAGGNLDKKIAVCGKLSESQIINYTLQIGTALEFMHSNHMLHLDMKPKNVMLTTGDTVKLIDFGLSKQFDDSGKPETSTTIGIGTPGYAPLEQANYSSDSGDFPATMDVYALGATMFKMATGHRPPDSSDIFNDGFPQYNLAHVSTNLRMIIERSMSPKKMSRYQTVRLMLNEIRSFYPSNTEYFEDPEDTIADVFNGKKNADGYGKAETGIIKTDIVPVYSTLNFSGYITSRYGSENPNLVGYEETSLGTLILVCDNMIGLNVESTMSKLVFKTISEFIHDSDVGEEPSAILVNAIQKVNQIIYHKRNNYHDLNNKGISLSALLISRDYAIVAHVGNCRLYQIRNGKKIFQTIDHSAAFDLAKKGLISEEQASNHPQSIISTQGIGLKSTVEVDVDVLSYKKRDRFLLCSVGFWSALLEKDLIYQISSDRKIDSILDSTCNVIEAAARKKGSDEVNLCVALIEMGQLSLSQKKKINKDIIGFSVAIVFAILVLIALAII